MFKSTIEFDFAMEEILRAIHDNRPQKDAYERMDYKDYVQAVRRCIQLNLVEGLEIKHNATICKVFESEPRLTYEGLQFLHL